MHRQCERTLGELVWDTVAAFSPQSPAAGQPGNSTDAWDQLLVAGGNGEGTLWYPGRPDKIGGATSPGRHCHSTPSSTGIDCHSVGIHTVLLWSLLSCSAKVTVPPRARRDARAGGQPPPQADPRGPGAQKFSITLYLEVLS